MFHPKCSKIVNVTWLQRDGHTLLRRLWIFIVDITKYLNASYKFNKCLFSTSLRFKFTLSNNFPIWFNCIHIAKIGSYWRVVLISTTDYTDVNWDLPIKICWYLFLCEIIFCLHWIWTYARKQHNSSIILLLVLNIPKWNWCVQGKELEDREAVYDVW